jgi:hypothetical protein
MIPWEEIKKFLPQYLSAESTQTLLNELDRFPENIDSRLYSMKLMDKEVVFQGDVLKGLPVISLPDPTINYHAPAMILSNTCDNDPKESRIIPKNHTYATILKLDFIIDQLKDSGEDNSRIENFMLQLKKQRITNLLYLPKGFGMADESVVFLDKINSCGNPLEDKNVKDMRVLCLSDYGFYLLLFKLSVHFTRIQERVERNAGTVY